MEIEVVKFDNLGRGIGYLDNKIIFIPKTVPGDLVKVKIIKNKKNFLIGKIIEIIKPSKLRIKAICPLFNTCGGCDLMHISLSEALDYKLNKVNDILKKNKIDYKVLKIVKSKPYNYRYKITLKIQDGIIGYYESTTHQVVPCSYCYLVREEINQIIPALKKLNILNGEVTIRVNSKGEILLIINSLDKIANISNLIHDFAIVGIIQNAKCLYGEEYFMENIESYLFKISYNSFFQVNEEICAKLFDLIKDNTLFSHNILDLYCGVGSLSIATNKEAKVLGVEIIPNAIKDANFNKKVNKRDNAEFICANTSDVINKITSQYDTIILDPPRNGVSKEVLTKIKEEKISQIIYVSCDANTLGRDLNYLLDTYKIKEFILLDMFPNTEHVESFCVLNLK